MAMFGCKERLGNIISGQQLYIQLNLGATNKRNNEGMDIGEQLESLLLTVSILIYGPCSRSAHAIFWDIQK